MTNQVAFQLEMSFIPNPEIEPSFFIWLTDSDGEPVNLPYPLFETLIKNNKITQHFVSKTTKPMSTVLIEDDFVSVSGMAVSMVNVFDTLTASSLMSLSSDYFVLGPTFQYWNVLAKSLELHLQKGLYYPVLFSFASGQGRMLCARWMLSREAIQRSGQFHQWLHLAPYNLFSLLELGTMTINDWQNLLIDTWIDQLIREKIASPSIPSLSDYQGVEIVQMWMRHLSREKPLGVFSIEADPDTMKVVRFLEQQIDRLYRPLSGAAHGEAKRALMNHLKRMITSAFKPQLILLEGQPESMADPFTEFRPWQVKLSIYGVKEGKRIKIESQEIQQLDPITKNWLTDKMNNLETLSDELAAFLDYQPLHPYECAVSFKTILSLHKQQHVLERLGVKLSIPEQLDWRSISENEVSVNLSANEERGVEKSESFSMARLSLESLIRFDWKIAVGDIELTFDEFKQLVEREQRIVLHNNEWIEIPLERMAEAYNELHDFEADVMKRQASMSDLLRVYLKAEERKTKRVAIKIQDQMEDYLGRLLSRKPIKELPVPKDLDGTLRPYQIHGFQWLCGLRERGVGGCLADDMGLGKTIQTITYLLSIKESTDKDDGQFNPSLIICPTSVIENWAHEITRFAPTLVQYVHHGPKRLNKETFNEVAKKVDVVITSYPLFVRDSQFLLKQIWDTVILDEAQMIKNPTTKQSQVVRRIFAQQRFALTGTPMENKLEELWSIMGFLNPGYLGSLHQFRSSFINPIEKHGDEAKVQLIRKLTQPFLLRRTKNDPKIIQDLPEKFEERIHCPLTKDQASIYQSVVDGLMNRMQTSIGIERKGLILAAITRLKQICNHPAFFTGERFDHEPVDQIIAASGKFKKFIELLNPILANKDKVLVFTQYVKTGVLLQQTINKRYKDCPVFFLHGGIPSDKRIAMIESFRELHGKHAVFILSLKAGGVGLNLTEANHVIHFDRWWNPAVENQATDRAYRIGQDQNVHVYKLISQGTLEEGIDQLIEKKKWLTDQVIGTGDRWITEMTDEEVLELVQLRDQVASS